MTPPSRRSLGLPPPEAYLDHAASTPVRPEVLAVDRRTGRDRARDYLGIDRRRILLAVVTGSLGFAPNPFDGILFLFEPSRPLAATIVDGAEGLSVRPFGETMYAFAFILIFSTALLSFAGWAARASLAKYSIGAR